MKTKTQFIPQHPDILRDEIAKLRETNATLIHAIRNIDSNAAESVEWIRRVTRNTLQLIGEQL